MKDLKDLNIKNKKYIIFDLDGTLIDSIGIWNITDCALIKKFSNKEISQDVIQNDRDYFLHNNTFGEIYIEYCKFLIDKYGLDIKDERQLSKIRRELYKEIYENEIEFKPNVADLLLKLKEYGYIIILATMSSKDQINTYSQSKKLISKINIKDVFDLITTKESVTNKKPDPEIYNNIVAYYNEEPSKFLVFEDSYSGSVASKQAGIETINIYDKYSDKDREKINNLVDYSISDYQEFLDYLENLYVRKKTKN